MQQALLLPIGDRAETLKALILNVQELQRLVSPFDPDLGGSRLIAFPDHQLDKFRLVKLGRNDNILPFLYVCADADYKLRVALEFFRVHVFLLPCCLTKLRRSAALIF